MAVRWLTRRTTGAPMPVEYKAPEIPINMLGQIGNARQIVSGKIIGLMVHGKSIQELEYRIEEFKDLPITWISINRFDMMQDFILNKIDYQLPLALDVAEVTYAEDFEKQIRVPRWKKFFEINPEGYIITSTNIIDGIRQFWPGGDALGQFMSHIIEIKDCRSLLVPNSVAIYLLALVKLGAKKIIIFGMDGFGKKSAFKDTPLWNAGEMECMNPEANLGTYYRPETIIIERKVGFRDENASYLHSDGPSFNDQFRKIYARFCTDNNIQPIEIVNCSPISLFTIFKKISYQQLREEVLQ